jgi:hypothetical protein
MCPGQLSRYSPLPAFAGSVTFIGSPLLVSEMFPQEIYALIKKNDPIACSDK